MSSTTEDPRARGQVLVIFGLSLFTIIVIAALAFDTGMMLLDRRHQQNAADAAALAGARYLIDPVPQDPETAARAVGTANGFTDGEESEIVDVFIPPQSGDFTGQPGFIEVVIHNNRPSIFGGIVGVFGWDVSARAVAANQPGLDLPFSMLTLHPTACAALKVQGDGEVMSAGTVQVNSACPGNALDVGGLGNLTVTAEGATCNAVGGIDEHGANAELNCDQVPNSYAIQDPLRNLPPPPVPPYPADIQRVSGSRPIPTGCPGSANEATAAAPAKCLFGGPGGNVYRLYPGYYPGGIDLGKDTFYLEPGVYYVGGGGFRAANGNVLSVDTAGSTFGGGVLIYNTEAYLFHDACAAGTAPNPGVQCIGAVVLNGGSSGVNLLPLDDGSNWDGLVIFQDRNLSVSGTDVQINGGGSVMEVAGTIYAPSGEVVVNGNAGTLILDQIIALTFQVTGNGGTIEVKYRTGVIAHISGVGLVE